ncbi:MAG TPA: M23 family metallopeptidase [Methylibium sp.]|uniref:M23 family metallopeptidase n=1 Tax=Methylibium sp. TaxID=2067992 RepID=UPI002DB89422|nr:M23 family metallopeptidase [Methylibium sp.]HEU4459296.1 M23 family metallopeptidase [Methylibium sp.]
MQVIVTHGRLAKSRVMNMPGWQFAVAGALLAALLLLVSGLAYHFLVLKAAREGWPVVSRIVKLVVRDETAQRDRVMRENLDAMASRVGELQAKLVRLESMGERVSGLAGLKADDFRGLDRPALPAVAASGAGRGGPFVPADRGPVATVAVSTLDQLAASLATLDESADRNADVFTLIESRLLESRLRALLVPSSAPVTGPVGSGFGFRSDPFTGRGALHTGLDFPADSGTPILAAAGGVVLSTETHPAYGRTVELDHGNGLVTRYAHASKVVVTHGDLIRRGQKIAEVGSSGRSTGPHLHFEVLVDGAPQDPAKFLAQAGRHSAAVARGATGEAFGGAKPKLRREAASEPFEERREAAAEPADDRRDTASLAAAGAERKRRRPRAEVPDAEAPAAAPSAGIRETVTPVAPQVPPPAATPDAASSR